MSSTLELKIVFAAVNKFSSAAQKINKESRELSKELKAAKDAMKDLEKQQGLIDAFRSTNKSLGITSNDLRVARERVEQMAKAMESVGVPSSKMQRDFKNATEEARHLAATVNRLAEKKQRLRGELSAVGIDTKKLSNHQRDLKAKLEEAASAVDKQKKSLEALNKTQQKVHTFRADVDTAKEKAGVIAGKGVGMMAAGATVSAGAGYLVSKFATLQESTTLLKTSLMDASGKVDSSFDDIMKKAKELGTALPGTPRDFVESARALKQQGLGTPTIVNGGLQAAGYLGVRFKMDQTRAAEFIAKAKEAHGLKDGDLPAAADYMHRAKEAYGLKQDDIYESMKYAATDLNLKGQVGDMGKLKEYLAIQGAAGQAGLEGSTFGTNFSHMLKVMASVSGKLDGVRGKEGKEIKELLDQFKIQFDFYGKDGKFLGFENMVRELQKLKPLKDQDQERVLKKLFDTEGSRVAGLLLKMGTDGYQQNLSKLENIASLNRVIEEMSKTLTFQTEAFQGNLETLSASAGQHLEPMAAGSLENLNKVIEFVQKFNQEHPVFSGYLIKTVAILGTVLTVLGGLALGMSVFTLIGPYLAAMGVGANFVALLSGALGILKGAIVLVGRALLTNPIGLTLAGIAIAAYAIYNNWDWLKEQFTATIDRILGKIEKFRKLMQDLANFSPFGNSGQSWQPPLPHPAATAAAPVPAMAAKPLQATVLAPVVAPSASRRDDRHSIFNINVTGTHGASPAELATQIRRELENAEREKATKQRSRLRDLE